MSTPRALKIIKDTADIKRSEGKQELVLIDTNLSELQDKYSSYIKSSMSYCNAKSIEEFNPLEVETGIVSQSVSNDLGSKKTVN